MVRKEYAARLEYDDKPASEPGRFTYSITPRTLVIKDTGRGTKSVAEDLEAVLRRIEHWHHGSVTHLKVTIVDSKSKPVRY